MTRASQIAFVACLTAGSALLALALLEYAAYGRFVLSWMWQ